MKERITVSDRRRSHFATVPHLLIDDPEVDRNALLLYLALARIANFTTGSTNGHALTTKELCKMARLRQGEGFYAARRLLSSAGYLTYTESGGGVPCEYQLCEPEPSQNKGLESPEPTRNASDDLRETRRLSEVNLRDGAAVEKSSPLIGSRDIPNPNDDVPSSVCATSNLKGKNPEPDGDAQGFETFWVVYPRRVAKGNARAAWRRALKRAEPASIIAGAQRFAADPKLPSGTEARFIPHPATWLNGDRWADEAPVAPAEPVWRVEPPHKPEPGEWVDEVYIVTCRAHGWPIDAYIQQQYDDQNAERERAWAEQQSRRTQRARVSA